MKNNFMWGDESFNDVYEGKQKNIKHKKYILNGMTGIIDIGLYRKKQEDSLLLMNENGVELMAISDGMGGLLNGEIASNYALLTIALWFKKININTNSDEKYILEELKKLVLEISKQIYFCYQGGATLVLALKLKNNTITLNIGDSRIYIYKNNDLKQISIDQSYAWELFEKGNIKNKDDIRFYKYNNIISYYLGSYLQDDSKIINNNDYDNIILASDGITDLISDYDILSCIRKNKNNYEEDILKYCLNKTDYNFELDYEDYNNQTLPGKDNASIIVYRKK